MWTRILVVCLAAGIGLHAQSPTVREAIEKGRQLYIEGDTAAALELVTRTLRTEAATLTPAGSGTLLWLLACIQQMRGEFDEADVRYRASTAALERAGAAQALLLARVRLDYASLLISRGAHKEAARLQAASLAAYEAAYDADHPDLLLTRAEIVIRQFTQGQFDQAAALSRDIIARWETAGLPRNLDLARLYDLLAHVLLRKGEAPEATRLYEQSLQIVEAHSGQSHPFLLDALIGRAVALTQLQEFTGVQKLLERAETITLAAFGKEHPFLGLVLRAKVNLLRTSGRKADARAEEKRLRTWTRESAKRRQSVSWAEWTAVRRP